MENHLSVDSGFVDRLGQQLQKGEIESLKQLTPAERKVLQAALAIFAKDPHAPVSIEKTLHDKVIRQETLAVDHLIQGISKKVMDPDAVSKQMDVTFKVIDLKKQDSVLTKGLWKEIKVWGQHLPEIQEIGRKFKINQELIQQTKEQYIENKEALQSAPSPQFGKKRNEILIPNDLPVVIRLHAEDRVNLQEEAFAVCQMNRYQNIAVPRGEIHGNFIIEEKIGSNEPKTGAAAIAFYGEHLEGYNQAVKEFTHFLCHADLGDLTDHTGGHLPALAMSFDAAYPRFDNVLLYEEKGSYKIGLIDLDEFSLHEKQPDVRTISTAVSTAIKLFPHHAGLIIDEGYKNLPKEVKNGLPLEKFQEPFQKTIERQLNFIEALEGRAAIDIVEN